MRGYYTHVTLACDGIPRRHALISLSLDDARREAALLAAALYPGRRFTYWVRPL
jgi:hypothetical protein